MQVFAQVAMEAMTGSSRGKSLTCWFERVVRAVTTARAETTVKIQSLVLMPEFKSLLLWFGPERVDQVFIAEEF